MADNKETFDQRMERQAREATVAVREQVGEDAFVSSDAKFHVSVVGRSSSDTVLVDTYEWGEHGEEVPITGEDAQRLRDWLIARFPLDTGAALIKPGTVIEGVTFGGDDYHGPWLCLASGSSTDFNDAAKSTQWATFRGLNPWQSFYAISGDDLVDALSAASEVTAPGQ